MELHNDKLSSYLIGLENEIKTNPEALTVNMIDQSQARLHSIILQLERIRSSKITNRMTPDVLYDIFKLAVYSSDHPNRAAVVISSVCRHWRKLALDSPALWGFADFNKPLSFLKLYIGRSKDAPLSLSWTQPRIYDMKKSYFESCASSILPRLHSLTLQVEFQKIQHVFQDTRLPPLRLRHLDFKLLRASNETEDSPRPSVTVTDFMRLDVSCLRELKLEGSDLPLLQPLHDKFTHFKLWYPVNPPTLSQLLSFLSNCPLLCELEFGIDGYDGEHMDASTSLSTIKRLDFPNLKKLILVTDRMRATEYNYLQGLSACMRNLESLSQFKLSYDGPGIDQLVGLSLIPPNIFGPIPSGTFSHFEGHNYLSISIRLRYHPFMGHFQIHSAPSVPEHGCDPSSYPLSLSGLWSSSFLANQAPILELIGAMPKITHLALHSRAWEILTSLNTDVRNAFPCLDTLELSMTSRSDDKFAEALNSLPRSLRLETLILRDVDVASSEALLDAVSRTGAEVVKLSMRPGDYYESDFPEAVAALRHRGITVLMELLDGDHKVQLK